ncbi:MAG: adenosylcobinamide-GDP ribazoletransferase [Cyanobacteriota bacterium]
MSPPPSRLRQALADASGAWIFYSVLPAWPGVTPRFERIARFAPLVGVVLGGVQGLLWWLLAPWLPPEAAALLVLALGLWLSGGLHADGAMDTADGLAAGPRALAAMEDSRVGAAGVQAFAQVLLLKLAGVLCLAVLTPVGVAVALLWTGWGARIAPLLAMHAFPYLREAGTAGFHRQHRRGLLRELLPALLVLPLLLAALLPSWPRGQLALAAGLLALLPPLLVPVWIGRRLGGHSGDTYGACVEWSEALGLLLMGLVARLAA